MLQSKVVLLSCGSFNPPTNMHLRLFEIAKDYLNKTGRYQVVCGIISPVHDNYGKKDLISSSHRCALVKLAVQDTNWIFLSDWECKQPEWQPTLKVIQYHQNKLNSCQTDNLGSKRQLNNELPAWVDYAQRFSDFNDKGITVKLLCGADLLETFSIPGVWNEHDIETIVGDHGLAVVTRHGSDPYKFIYESDTLSKHMNNIAVIQEWITNEISSTKIRRSLRRGESVKYLIPNEVIDYIKNNGLYETLNNKYMYPPSSVYLTPSPNDVIMTMTPIDVPDASGNYMKSVEAKRARPGHVVATRKVNMEECIDEAIDETRVEIQITEDGRIEVISDKETTV